MALEWSRLRGAYQGESGSGVRLNKPVILSAAPGGPAGGRGVEGPPTSFFLGHAFAGAFPVRLAMRVRKGGYRRSFDSATPA